MAANTAGDPPGLAGEREMQGLEGAYTFPERLLQQIWRRREFDDTAAHTLAGEPLRVLHPGRWNRLGGPDFHQARLRLAGRSLVGDVELHLHAADWDAHGHGDDPAYLGVILHAVLFPPGPAGRVARRRDGVPLPVLVLLPLLRRGLEEYAEEEVVETLARRPAAPGLESLLALPAAERTWRLRACAEARWQLKRQYAALRIARLGWSSACHHTALEILGYRRNREPMLRLAGHFPLETWQDPATVAVALASEAGRWAGQGVRPANRPAARLRQYAEWVTRVPDWPDRLQALAAGVPAGEPAPANVAAWRRALGIGTGAHAVGGPRLDTLIADGFLPLLAAGPGAPLQAWWLAWPAGDLPDFLLELRAVLAGEGGSPPSRSQGFVQGVLGWLIEQERRTCQ